MKVFWDGFGLDRKHSGIYHFAENLYHALQDQGVLPQVLFPRSLKNKHTFDNIISINSNRIKSSRFLWSRTLAIKLNEFDSLNKNLIYHGLANVNLPLNKRFLKSFRTVVTVHDIIPILAPNKVSFLSSTYFRFAFKRMLDAVDLVVCDSGWTKHSIMDRFPQVSNKLKVVYAGVPEFRNNSAKSLCQQDHISILYVSRYEQYKNFDTLVDIIRASRGGVRATIVTNEVGRNYLLRFGDLIGREELVIKSGLSDKELGQCYQDCHVYVHPSQFEGFGLPLNEAISYGRPVVYRSGSAPDELISKEVGIGIDASCSPSDWIDAIKTMKLRAESSNFDDDCQKSLRHIGGWDTSANKLKTLYENLLK